MSHPARYRLICRIALGAIACGLPAAGGACDTPVYRYALFHWTASPYHVVYFKQGPPRASDGEIARLVGKLGEGDAAANLVLDPFDPAHDKIDEMPAPVQVAWKSHKDAQPAYLVLTPQGVEIFAGRLEASTLRALTDSPARQKLCRQIDAGNAVVFLLVPGKDPAENRRARKAVEELVAQADATAWAKKAEPLCPQAGVAAGANRVAAGVNHAAARANRVAAGQHEAVEESVAQRIPVKLGLLEVSRTDPAEAWLMRAMMTVEPDLAGLVDQPMVFAVYGRARVLEPYVGKGITVDNLTQLVDFVTGACSCQVKDSNPGVDLLTAWNWDATAERVAAKDSDSPLDAVAGGYAEVGGQGAAASAGDSRDSAARGNTGAGSDSPSPRLRVPASPRPLSTAGQAGSGSHTPARSVSELASAGHIRADTARLGEEPMPFAHRLAWRLGLGLLAAAAVVLAAGLVLVRHRGPL